MKYCSACGTPLEYRDFEGRERAFCVQCHRFHFRQLKVGAGGLIEQDNKLLLLQRAHAPFQGDWNLPAGYVEYDEHPSQTVVREIQEESGLQVRVDRLYDIYLFTDDPRGNGLLIVYTCQILGGELRATAEGFNPLFFSRGDLPNNLAGGGHNQAILAWKTTEKS